MLGMDRLCILLPCWIAAAGVSGFLFLCFYYSLPSELFFACRLVLKMELWMGYPLSIIAEDALGCLWLMAVQHGVWLCCFILAQLCGILCFSTLCVYHNKTWTLVHSSTPSRVVSPQTRLLHSLLQQTLGGPLDLLCMFQYGLHAADYFTGCVMLPTPPMAHQHGQ